MLSHRYHDEILFYHEGGVDVGDVDAKAEKLELPTGEAPAGRAQPRAEDSSG